MQPIASQNFVLTPLGFSRREEEVYRAILRHSGDTLTHIASLSGSSQRQFERELSRLVELGLVEVVDGAVVAAPPHGPLNRLITEKAQRLRAVSEQIESLRSLLPVFSQEHVAEDQEGEPVIGKVIEGGHVSAILREVAQESSGDLLWLRPDQWQITAGMQTDDLVREFTALGRRSRAIYPARVLELSPETVQARTELGEEVRIIARVPSRMAIMGDGGVLVPERWGVNNERRLLIRQQSVVMSMHQLFERLWERALPVPGLGAGQFQKFSRERTLLLQELAVGAKDEQIARSMGLSLRTVRRRVADLVDELGVESRFQAGVEAARRGWL